MAPDPEHDIPEDDGPSPLGAEGEHPFGVGPFGEGPFGPRDEDEDEDTPVVDEPGVTILQRHKVDVALSKRKWLAYRDEWKREREEKECRRKKKRKAEKDAKAKREREAVAYAGEREFGAGLAALQRQLEAVFAEAQRQVALQRAQSLDLTMAAERYYRMQQAEIMRQMMADRYRQAILEQQEEREVLELLLAA